MSALFSLIEPWLLQAGSDDILALHKHLMWLQKELFNEYEPHQYETFDDKIAEWLQNIPGDRDRMALFRLLDHFFFVGKQQFDALCRAAYTDDITRWLIEKSSIDIVAPDVDAQLSNAVSKTWFCPLTDSMRINSFLKLNNLTGHDNRPDWYSLRLLAHPIFISRYMSRFGIERLVILEDFVGSGKQMRATVSWAAATFPGLQILFVPLICCPKGIETAGTIVKNFSNVSFAPTLSLKSELFLLSTAAANEPSVFADIRRIALQISSRLGIYQPIPFGFEGTGALVAMYSNCPDNTLPMIHHKTPTWNPLFERVQRS